MRRTQNKYMQPQFCAGKHFLRVTLGQFRLRARSAVTVRVPGRKNGRCSVILFVVRNVCSPCAIHVLFTVLK